MIYNKNHLQNIVSEKLKTTLKSHGLTPAELAEQTDINVRTVYSILNGHQMGSADKLQRICTVLHISMDDLFELQVNSYPIFPKPYEEGRSYSHFEKIWFGEEGGERISVSRGFSVMNQSKELREDILKKVYGYSGKDLTVAMDSFLERKEIIEKREKNRLEIVVKSEIKDFILRRSPYDQVKKHLINDCVEHIIDRLKNDNLRFEVVFIPRQWFLVNYEIINRKVILFDMGTIFLKQQNTIILEHFLQEVHDLKTNHSLFRDTETQIEYLRGLLSAK